jgi:hypothetical protein
LPGIPSQTTGAFTVTLEDTERFQRIMQEQPATPVPPQNFAVSSSGRSAPHHPPAGAAVPPQDLLRLARARTDAWKRWWRLYNEPNVWTDPAKRRAMCIARLAYHDAYFALTTALDSAVKARNAA